MKPVIKMSDIARELSVITVIVSKALSGKDGVSGALKETIIQKAEELGYVYNSLPRNMRESRHYLIGILISSKFIGDSSFYWIFYKKLLEVLKQTPYLGVLEVIGDGDELNCAVPSVLSAKKVDGIIILGQMRDPYLATITSKTSQCIFLDCYASIGSCDCVMMSNNFLGSYNLTKLLIAAGHKTIGFIGSTAATTSILDRYLGFCRAMMEAGLPCEAAIEDRDGNGNYIMLCPDTCTAYVCNNDQIAGIGINQMRKSGMNVPKDMWLAGFDNESDLLIQHIEAPGYVCRGHAFIDGRVVVKQPIAAPSR
ncbi:MAG: substrate-binding domain-containing protein [Treponema sp.]|jgi:LacI family transcriptional regulator|nr:substrate-binding domain-containing protein [Treponema sp.]